MPKINNSEQPFKRLLNVKSVCKEISIPEAKADEFRNFYPRMTQFIKGRTTFISPEMLAAFEKEARKQFREMMDWIKEKKKETKDAA